MNVVVDRFISLRVLGWADPIICHGGSRDWFMADRPATPIAIRRSTINEVRPFYADDAPEGMPTKLRDIAASVLTLGHCLMLVADEYQSVLDEINKP